MSTSLRNRLRPFLAASAAIALLPLTACSIVNQTFGDAWSVTYQVAVDRPQDVELTEVTVEGAEKRGASPEVTDLGSQTALASTGGEGALWDREVIVLAGEEALVSATPPSGSIATCRVLVDGTREIATATSAAPGEPVTCKVVTPAFG